MNVLGVELEYDFLDADQLEVYERENRRVADDIKEPSQYEGKSTADSIRLQCRIVDRFFDAVFGEGTARKIFRGKSNIRDHMEAFGIVAQAAQESGASLKSLEDKYAPNRAERRQEERAEQYGRNQGSRNYHRVARNGRGHGRRN